MVMTLIRSGGFAGMPGLRVQATVTFEPDHGVVVSGDYSRSLGAAESAALHEDALAVEKATAAGQAAPENSSPDAFRLQMTIDTGPRRVEVSGGSMLQGARRELERLTGWAERECDAIIRRRFEAGR